MGYFGVHLNNPGKPKPYQVQVWRGGKTMSMSVFSSRMSVFSSRVRSSNL